MVYVDKSGGREGEVQPLLQRVVHDPRALSRENARFSSVVGFVVVDGTLRPGACVRNVLTDLGTLVVPGGMHPASSQGPVPAGGSGTGLPAGSRRRTSSGRYASSPH
jgi:hypothetical protein